jgi:hypothetical protein
MSYNLLLDACTFDDIKTGQFEGTSSSHKLGVGVVPKLAMMALGVSLATADATNESYTMPIASYIQADGSSATALVLPTDVLDLTSQLIKNALYNAQHEVFKSGMESSFGRFINRFILQYGQKGLEALGSSLRDSALSADVIAEAIRSLGEMRDASTLTGRFTLLLRYLDHESPVVRDAAALAFADLGDKNAISQLRVAAEHEKFSSVRSSFLSVAKELEET